MKGLLKKLVIGLGCLFPITAMAIPAGQAFPGVGLAGESWGGAIQHQQFYFENSGRGEFPIGSGSDGVPIKTTEMKVRLSLVGVAYHPNKDSFFFAFFPYVEKDLRSQDTFINFKLRSMADPIVGYLHRIYLKQGLGWFFSVAGLFSMGIPAADFEHKFPASPAPIPPDRKIPRPFQNGKGNWAQTVALPIFYEDTRKMLTVNLSYTNHIKGYGFRHANVGELAIATSYKIYPWVYESEVWYPVDLKANLEFFATKTWDHSATNTGQDFDNEDSNDLVTKLAPGLTLEGTGWALNFLYFIRLSDNPKGNAPVRFKNSWLLNLFYEFG